MPRKNSTSGRKTRVIELFSTPLMVESSSVYNDICAALAKELPYNYKFYGEVPESLQEKKLEEGSKLTPHILLVVQFSLLSWGKILQAVFEDKYDHIIVYDNDCHDFDIPRMLNELIVMGSYRGIERLGTKDPKEIVKKIKKVEVIPDGFNLLRALLSVTGDTDLVKPKTNLFKNNYQALETRIDAKGKPFNVPDHLQAPADAAKITKAREETKKEILKNASPSAKN